MTPSRKPSRGLLVLALALVVLAAAAVAGVALVNARPVDPAKVDRETLLQWIVTRDLAQEPTATRLALVRRLEEECRRGIDWDSLGGQLTDSQRQQLWDNIPLLLGFVDCGQGRIVCPIASRGAARVVGRGNRHDGGVARRRIVAAAKRGGGKIATAREHIGDGTGRDRAAEEFRSAGDSRATRPIFAGPSDAMADAELAEREVTRISHKV